MPNCLLKDAKYARSSFIAGDSQDDALHRWAETTKGLAYYVCLLRCFPLGISIYYNEYLLCLYRRGSKNLVEDEIIQSPMIYLVYNIPIQENKMIPLQADSCDRRLRSSIFLVLLSICSTYQDKTGTVSRMVSYSEMEKKVHKSQSRKNRREIEIHLGGSPQSGRNTKVVQWSNMCQ